MGKPFECGDVIVSKIERSNKTYVVIDCTSNMVNYHTVGDKDDKYWRSINTVELKSEAVR